MKASDVLIPWKKITRGLPKGRKFADDRSPTIEEIARVVEYPDRRIKAIVCTMSSSGIRLGAWDYLRWKDIQPITRNGKVVAAKVIVYAEDDEEYLSFITPHTHVENCSIFWGDELQVLTKNQADELIDIMSGFIGKSDPYIIFTGTAGKPGDCLDSIFAEPDDVTVFQRFKQLIVGS